MHLFVHMFALNRQRILRPHIFYMYQRALPLAEYKMLQSGKHEQIIFVERLFGAHHMASAIVEHD
jgi:hypothetical protein